MTNPLQLTQFRLGFFPWERGTFDIDNLGSVKQLVLPALISVGAFAQIPLYSSNHSSH